MEPCTGAIYHEMVELEESSMFCQLFLFAFLCATLLKLLFWLLKFECSSSNYPFSSKYLVLIFNYLLQF